MKLTQVKDWLIRHRLAVAAGVLLAFTVSLVGIAPFLRRKAEKTDPQEQIGIRWIKPVGSETAYAGNEACKTCHPHEFELYNSSPHSRTVKAIRQGVERPEFSSSQTVTDDLNGVSYTVQKGAGKNQLTATAGSTSKVAAARWAFGSGTHAWTYLAQNGPKFLQLRITYYPPEKEWNFTPGSGPGSPFHNPLGDPYTSAGAAACFGCHSTILTGTRTSLDLDHSILNVGCESCHGPCRSHIESMTRSPSPPTETPRPPVSRSTPSTHNGPQVMQLCGECHRIPIAVSNEMTASESQLARFPGVALPRSRCFIASAGKLSCITCHDPHQSTVRQTERSFDVKCINCHTAPHGTVCAQGATTGCVTCHMPLESIGRKLPLRFHNHWIRKDPSGLN